MMTILDKILMEKEREVVQLLERAGQTGPSGMTAGPSLTDRLRRAERLQVIAEIKRASPSKGMIRQHVDPVRQALQYEQAGAACISVLTDEVFFKGSYDDLAAVAQAVQIPVLCKDFIIHPVQIDRAKAAGASVVLLIAAALPDPELNALYAYAKSCGLDVLLEVHSEQELDRALAAGAQLIGVNNRDLRTFEVDLARTEQLAALFPHDGQRVLISESGIAGPADAARAAAAGASAVLVGESLMKSGDPGRMIRSLQTGRKGTDS